MSKPCINAYPTLLKKEEDLKTCDSILRGMGWGFGFKSDVKSGADSLVRETNYYNSNIPFWKLPLGEEKFFTEYMFSILKERTQINFELLEVYCNGQTYGQDGYPHIDNVWGETHTFLYYANINWNMTWGGQTVFIHEGQRYGIDPIPNSAILFTTDLLHYGEAYNQFCRDLRMTVCYKLKKN